MRWIKASERLGNFQDSDIPEWKFWHPDFCKIDGKPAERPVFRKDIEKGTVVFSHNYMKAGNFWQELDQTHFHRIEWLDESTTVAPPVSEEGGIEAAADEYIKRQGSHDRPDITKHDFKQGYIAGANSVRQQGDVKDNPVLKPLKDEIQNLLDEKYKILEAPEINNLFRSFHAICERRGATTHWDGITMQIKRVLDLWPMAPQSATIPQAGFIEQLRASNPYTPARIGYKQRGAIWNECVDKATELLNSPKTPNNEPII